jgi:hypothetical protein
MKMGIRELQKRQLELQEEYHQARKEIEDQILAIRRQRDPEYDRKKNEKDLKGWENYREPGRDYIPFTPNG